MVTPLLYNATLRDRVDITGELAIFRIAPDDPPSPPWFRPGQYCVVGLNNEERPELAAVRRPLTIASAPETNDPLEFYVRWVPVPDSQNPLSHLLWRLVPGDRLFLRTHAAGGFTVTDTVGHDDERLRLLVAAGTGVAPFVSMLRSAARAGDTLSQYALIHGASYPKQLAYDDELRRLATAHGLRYLATISRPDEIPGWSGDRGRAEDWLLPETLAALESRLGLSAGAITPQTAAVFVCGLRGTIGECIRRLIPRGFLPDHRRTREALGAPADRRPSLFYEQYDTAPVLETRSAEVMEPLRAAYQAAIELTQQRT